MKFRNIAICIIVMGFVAIIGEKFRPVRYVEKKQLPPEWAAEFVKCLQLSSKSLRECPDCPCYPPRWAARMAEMHVRLCAAEGGDDDTMMREMKKWNDGDYGWSTEHALKE